jgi:hypothetical protein
MVSGVKKIAEQAWRILGKRGADADLDKRELELTVRQSLSLIVRSRFFESKNQDYPEIPESLIVGYKNIEIQEDTDLNLLYVTLPSRIIDLPYGMGILLVSAQGNQKCGFLRSPAGFNSMSCGLESNCIPGKSYYYQEGNRLYFSNLGHENRPSKIYIRLVAPAEDLNTDDDLEMPGDMELEVLSRVLEVYGVYRPQDEINDQNDII